MTKLALVRITSLFVVVAALAACNSIPAQAPIEARAVATFDAPGAPDFIVTDRAAAWIVNRGRIEKWSLTSSAPIASVSIPRPCGAPEIGFGSLWVLDCSVRALYRIDPQVGTVQAMIPVGVADPNGEMSIAAGAGSVWVASDINGIVSRIDPLTNQPSATVTVRPGSYALAFGYGALWVVNTGLNDGGTGSVQRVDPASNSVVETVSVGRTPRFLTVGAGGVWVQNQQDGTVSRIDPTSNRLISTISVGANLKGGDIAVGAGRVWVRTSDDQVLVEISPRSNRIIGRLGSPSGSGAVRFGDDLLWVTAHDINKVWVLRLEANAR